MPDVNLPKFLAIVAATLALPAYAQDHLEWDSFLAAIGGSPSVKVVGASAVEALPLRRNADEIWGARFFKDRGASDPWVVTSQSLDNFTATCKKVGGSILPQDDERTTIFSNRVIANLTAPTGMRHQWRGRVAICDGPKGIPLAGFVSMIMDNTEIYRTGDSGSKMLGSLFGRLSNTTAIYLFRPNKITTKSALLQAKANEVARLEAGKAKIEEFRSKLAIGDETSCGTIIQIRGPLAEVAVPVTVQTPNGQQSFWSRKERLVPPGYGICTYGL